MQIYNGIYHENRLLIHIKEKMAPDGSRSLYEAGSIPDFLPSQSMQQLKEIIYARQECPEFLHARALCGGLRGCGEERGWAMLSRPEGDPNPTVYWAASFGYAMPFIGIEIHGAHLLLKNASGETWRFDCTDMRHVRAGILQGYHIP